MDAAPRPSVLLELRTGAFDALLRDGLDLVRIVLVPARVGVVLGELLLVLSYDSGGRVEDDEANGRCAAVERADELAVLELCHGGCRVLVAV